MSSLAWSVKGFSELSTDELYRILSLRNRIFVLEQKSIYLDTDDYDQKALHLMAFEDQKLVGYSRFFDQGIKEKEASLGRLVVDFERRKTGLGREILNRTLQEIGARFGNLPIRICAQAYLHNFYEAVGFLKISEPYIYDGIPHIDMLKAKEPAR